MGQGAAGHIGLAKETTWGTAVAATDYFEAMSEDLNLAIDRFDFRNITGDNFDPDDAAGIRRIEGSMSFAANPETIGHFLNGALGISSVTSIANELAKTEFTQRTVAAGDISSVAPLPTYTFEIFRDVTSAQQYAGNLINTLELSIQPNQDLRVTAGVIGKSVLSIAKTTPTYPGSPVSAFFFDTASVSIGGIGVDLIEALTINIDNQLEGIAALNASSNIARVRRTGPPLIGVTGTIDFQSIGEYDKFVALTEQAISINLFKADSFSLLIELPRVIYTAFPLTIPGRERLTVAFEGKGRYHTGSLTSIKATLFTVQSEW